MNGVLVELLAPGQSIVNETGDREVCLVMVTGTGTVETGGQTFEN
ncbi:MAG: 5-deoxy-glucuronate isomerase, partial [Rhodospirillaceae bacterium]|nr:5-deoxy-glucuronate isomerase [Rhodospirillaceae bacterium]